jgi:hypothetical protein
MRRGNISTHVQRKHANLLNPFPQMKESNCNFSQTKTPESSNFPSTQYDSNDSCQLPENARRFQDVVREISQWNKVELACLLSAIFRLPNFIS